MDSGLKCKGETLRSSLSRVYSEKIEMVKNKFSLRGNRRERFSVIDIIWSATQSDQLLQQLISTGFCVKSVLGEGEHLLYPNLKLFLYIKNHYCYHFGVPSIIFQYCIPKGTHTVPTHKQDQNQLYLQFAHVILKANFYYYILILFYYLVRV